MFDSVPKYLINFVIDESRIKSDVTIKCKLPNSIEIAGLEVIANTELSIKSTF
jgi:hypothetical protein